MRKAIRWTAVLPLLAVLFAGAAQAQKEPKGHGAMCPMHVEGAEIKVADTADGVTITITAKDPAAVKEIQAAAAAHAALKKADCPCCAAKPHKRAKAAVKEQAAQTVYVCPMGCYSGPKTADGRCPKCGMDLKKR